MSNDSTEEAASRREFLTGQALRSELQHAGSAFADELLDESAVPAAPTGGDTIRLGTRAMACDFAVIMNPGPGNQAAIASRALELVHELEDQMSVFRPESELSRLNRQAAIGPVAVEPRLFELLRDARNLAIATAGAFDPTSGPLVALWRQCRSEGRIPNDAEIAAALERTGSEHLAFEEQARTVEFRRPGLEFDLGGIGKGYALDRIGELLAADGLQNWLLHGGHSSLLARGDHDGLGGWPVGIRNPLFPGERLATVLLRDCGFSCSGSGVQYFRHGGKRYGHILDPRTGWPVEKMLSVVVLAPTAAEADALSTAFFVMGVEKTRDYCHNHPEIRAILIPPPDRGRTLEPVNFGIPDEVLFFTKAACSEA